MRKIKNIFLAFLALVVVACGDPELPFETFEELEKGAFARRLSLEGAFTFGQTATSVYNGSVEFYSEDQGKNVSSYDWTVEYVGVAGDKAAVNFLSIPSSSFGTNSDTGLPMATFSLGMTEALAALGLTEADITGGDRFRFKATLTLTNGRQLGVEETGVNIFSSSTFAHLALIDANVVCVSDLGGTYTSTTTGTSTDGCCPAETTVTGTVTLTDKGSGVYEISDWSAGIYVAWYGPAYGLPANHPDLTVDISDVCDDIVATFTEPYDTETVVTGSVNRATGVITYSWENGYADKATVILTPQ